MKELELFYKKNKPIFLPVLFIFLSIFIFFTIIEPQWVDIGDAKKSIKEKEGLVETKDKTVNLLNSIPQEKVDSDYELVTSALPIKKDIILIFSELRSAAEQTNVQLSGFTVNVGDVYSKEGKSETEVTAVTGIPYLSTTLLVEGANSAIKQFAEVLFKSLPIIEIGRVDINRDDGRIDVNLYYKPLTINLTDESFKETVGLDQNDDKQLEDFKQWTLTQGSSFDL